MVVRKSRLFFSLIVVFSLLLASCAGGNTNADQPAEVPATGETLVIPTEDLTVPTEDMTVPTEDMAVPTEDMAVEPEATPIVEDEETPMATEGGWQGEQIGGTLNVLAIWGGAEQDSFMAMIEPFEEQTGINVEYEGTRDLGAVLNTRIQGGNPPDVAALPNPGQLVELARAGALVPLGDVLDMEMMQEQYDQGFLDLASVDGQLYGIFTKSAVKSLVWYSPTAFDAAGYEVPETWQDVLDLEQQIIADGKTPWCVGIDGGGGSGWPGTDWVEDFLLHQSGPEVYDQWVNHEIPWTDENVRSAWEEFGRIVHDDQLVFGGSQTVQATNFGEAFNPMFQEDPGCYLFKQANFITSFFEEQFPDLEAGTDYDFFVFPALDEEIGQPLLVAGDLFGMFNDTPQARAFMQYLVTTDAQRIWAERGGFLSANRTMDPSVYPDPITQQIGEMLTEATSVRFDASDLMPEAVNSAFSTNVLQFPGNPGQLDTILEQIEAQAEESYQTQQ